jgi:hypothetical protein
MKSEEVEIGAIVGHRDRGSRWRAVIVGIPTRDGVGAGLIKLRDDEGIRPRQVQYPGILIDPSFFYLVEPPKPRYFELPEFSLRDGALVKEDDSIEKVQEHQ